MASLNLHAVLSHSKSSSLGFGLRYEKDPILKAGFGKVKNCFSVFQLFLITSMWGLSMND